MELWTRRKFFCEFGGGRGVGWGRPVVWPSAGRGHDLSVPLRVEAAGAAAGGGRAVMISSANGVNARGRRGMEILKGGGDTLEAGGGRG